MSDELYLKSCPVCDCNKVAPVRGYEEVYLHRCERCGFHFSNRIATPEELKIPYAKYSRSDWISPITLLRYQELLGYFEKYRRINTILDVGCGNGHFLKVALERGWKVYGIEYDEKAVQMCKNKDVPCHLGSILDFEAETQYDVITFFEVIEHLFYPKEHIQKAYRLLRHKGAIYITTPNLHSLSGYIVGKEIHDFFCYPEHVCYFTPYTLHRMLTEVGFHKVYMKTTGIDIFYIRNRLAKNKGLDSQSIRKERENFRHIISHNQLGKLAYRGINWILTITRLGDTIKALYVKK
ncbi:MAG: class I SAM-dependent methyltransferase [Bacteroidia bacterium]|nr:class I SAM-dependent methyltransferase [Bacteroidia bacterium]